MFFNLGGAEILVIAVVALIAVGPEQLPGVLRKVGRFMAQARSMTAGLREEFMSGIEEVTDLADPEAWMGSGSNDDPVVPRGYADRSTSTGSKAPKAAVGSADRAPDPAPARDGADTQGAPPEDGNGAPGGADTETSAALAPASTPTPTPAPAPASGDAEPTGSRELADGASSQNGAEPSVDDHEGEQT